MFVSHLVVRFQSVARQLKFEVIVLPDSLFVSSPVCGRVAQGVLLVQKKRAADLMASAAPLGSAVPFSGTSSAVVARLRCCCCEAHDIFGGCAGASAAVASTPVRGPQATVSTASPASAGAEHSAVSSSAPMDISETADGMAKIRPILSLRPLMLARALVAVLSAEFQTVSPALPS